MSPRRRTGAHPAEPLLFAPGELALRRTGAARFRALARRPKRSPTLREAYADEERAAMERLRGWGRDLASRFDLPYTSIEPERDGVFDHYGICYEDGLIRIRLRHAISGRLLKESSLVDTLCHELAHLRHLDHSPRFKRLYLRILEAARRLGYYRPGPERPRATQGSLFAGCGVRGGKR